MTIFKYFLLTIFIISILSILIYSIKSRKPIKFLLFNAFIGVTTLLILYFTRKLTGLNIALNPYTVIISSTLGVPAVILTLFLNFLIIM